MSDQPVTNKSAVAGQIARVVAILGVLLLFVFGIAYLVSPASRKAITQARCLTGGVLTHVYNQATPDDTKSGKVHSAAPLSLIQSKVQTGDNLVDNADVEFLKARNQPLSWHQAAPEGLSSTFSLVDGHDSNRALRVEVREHRSGNANWYSDNLPVVSGQYYEYSDYYRSDVQTTAVLTYRDAAGHDFYTDLGSMSAAGNWQQYKVRFFAPKGAVSLAVYHVIGANGYLETDDYSLAQATPGQLERGLVSVTFDDGWRTAYTQALPILDRYHIVTTQFIISGFVGAPAYLKPSQIYAFQRDGHEIASHTVRHGDLTGLDVAALDRELSTSRDQLSRCFGTTTSFAAPYGAYSDQVLTEAKKYYPSYRSTDRGFNTRDQFDPYHVVVQNVDAETPSSTVAGWVDTANRNQAWLVLVYHQIDKSNHTYSRSPSAFESDMKAIKSSQVVVKTYAEALREVQAQVH